MKRTKTKRTSRLKPLTPAKPKTDQGRSGDGNGMQGTPELEQILLQLLSIIYAPTAKTPIASCLKRCGVRTADGRQFTPALVDQLLTTLVRRKEVIADYQGYRLRPELCHGHTLEAIACGRYQEMAAAVTTEMPPVSQYRGSLYRSYPETLRDLRIAVYTGKGDEVWKALEACCQFPDQFSSRHPFLIFSEPLDLPWLEALPMDISLAIMANIIHYSFHAMIPRDELFALFEKRYRSEAGERFPYAALLLGTELMLRGRMDDALELAAGRERCGDLNVRAWADFLRGDDRSAVALYERSLAQLKKEMGKRKYFFSDIPGLFFIPALIRVGDPETLAKAEEHAAFVAGKKDWNYFQIMTLFSLLLKARSGDPAAQESIEQWTDQLCRRGHPLDLLFSLLVQYWTSGGQGQKLAAQALPRVRQLEKAGYRWLAEEIALACRALGAKCDTDAMEKRRQAEGIVPLHTLLSRRDAWESSLVALARLGEGEKGVAGGGVKGESRLVWLVSRFGKDNLHIEPKEQKRTAAGGWTSGRPVALKKLKDEAGAIPHLTPQDRKICANISEERRYYYRHGHGVYSIDPRTALPLMIGHPLVFVDDGDLLPLEIVAGEPELRVKREKNRLLLTVNPIPVADEVCLFLWETRTRLRVIEIGERFRRVAEIIGNGLTAPLAAERRVLESVGAVSSLVTVHSDIGAGAVGMEERGADHTPLILLTPYGDGLRLELKVRPLGEEGPMFAPGHGGATIIADLAGVRVQARRQLGQETAAAEAITARLPLDDAEEEGEHVWVFQDPADCLELLEVLQGVDEGEGRVLWPEGEKMRVTRAHDASGLSVSARGSADWFQLDGSLALDGGEVLELRRLMDLLQQRVGRFLPLGDGRFLTLTEQFRRRLEELRGMSERHGKGVRCAPTALMLLDELAEEAGEFRMDRAWRERLERMREAESLDPSLPTTLQAELREYQRDGFVWLARLAHWGAGACLADDMGLGKTIQALTLILTRAPGGPTLVAAPTSVCMNWETEARRFAPTLNPIVFGPGDRAELLKGLQPFDLVICSYGLMQLEEELLCGVEWRTIVLDEAQAIKNMATKRSQTAMRLKGEFRLITTGTPVENHLGELWNLFRFINPGLLGSHKAFSERFSLPIERNNDKGARERLKKLIRPFTLRRTKAQVLSELPPRTEVTIQVELSREEQAFYEAVRQNALVRIEVGDAGSGGDKRFRILAEIMRLRRACCHPRLVLPESPLAGSKLAACLELVEELLDGRHKALVFSQFVDHLEIVRAELDRLAIRYQYLDGATTPPERKRRVEAFQAGEGDLFLISLKAGGTGLNLTAADYVIHLDPWWNPAVEDQASDRAHRIGQSRPVTVYRLVAKGSIEEKIIALHQTKRDLADSLLEGTETGTRLTAEELLELLREG